MFEHACQGDYYYDVRQDDDSGDGQNENTNDKQNNRNKYNKCNSDSDGWLLWQPTTCVWSYTALWDTAVTHSYQARCTVGRSSKVTPVLKCAEQAMKQSQIKWQGVRAVFEVNPMATNDIQNTMRKYDIKRKQANFVYGDTTGTTDKFTAIWHNSKGMELHMPSITRRQQDVQLLTECSVPEHMTKEISAQCNDIGYTCHYGEAADLSKEQGKRRGRRVAALVKGGRDMTVPLHPECKDYR